MPPRKTGRTTEARRKGRRRWAAAAAAAALLAAAGCRSLTDPFLGVQEWQTLRYGRQAPDPRLADMPRITAVRTQPYEHYVREASEGRIVAQEVRGDWVYYAVVTRREVPAAEPGGEPLAAIVTERYRARIPPEPPPSPWIASRPIERRKATALTPDAEAEKRRKKLEADIRRRLKEAPAVPPAGEP